MFDVSLALPVSGRRERYWPCEVPASAWSRLESFLVGSMAQSYCASIYFISRDGLSSIS